MAGGGAENSTPLEFTPTWIVAAVCSVMVFISLALERTLHFLGKYLKKKNQKPLFEALQKVKEELMVLGFISLLLTVFQGAVSRICVPENLTRHMLPCKKEKQHTEAAATTAHFQSFFFSGILNGGRHLLAVDSKAGHCAAKGKVPLLSLEALHQLHIFIFVLAIVHVVFCLLTMILAGAKIRQWKHWEDSIAKDNYDTEKALDSNITHVHEHVFIQQHFSGIGKDSAILGWMYSLAKQFYGSVTKADYITLRLGFIMTHCRGNPKFNFHKYMIRALEADFKKVVGISWYLWIFVVIFLLLNVDGWHTYFWIAFLPLILLLAVGTKLEHVITQLAHEVAEKHIAVEGDLVVRPSDDHFWFDRPKIVLYLIHFILFQNAFEIAFFFWILTTYGFNSCIMGEVRYIVPRLVIGVIIQLLCSYSTLPLYAIVTQTGHGQTIYLMNSLREILCTGVGSVGLKILLSDVVIAGFKLFHYKIQRWLLMVTTIFLMKMGSSFKKAIFDEHVQEGLVGWAQKVKKRKAIRVANGRDNSSHVGSTDGSSLGIQLQKVGEREEGNINRPTALNGHDP